MSFFPSHMHLSCPVPMCEMSSTFGLLSHDCAPLLPDPASELLATLAAATNPLTLPVLHLAILVGFSQILKIVFRGTVVSEPDVVSHACIPALRRLGRGF